MLILADLMSPCKTLFGMVIRLDKLFNTLLVLDLTGAGKALYPFATGLKIASSKPWFRPNVALFIFSKQSLVGLFFFESFNSPSDPANAFVEINIAIKKFL